jgi:hypothetical protein
LKEFACKLFVDEMCILNGRYQTLATEKSSFLGSSIYAFCTNDEVAKDEPANINRFRVYVEEHSKFSDITVEHYSNIVVTYTSGIRKLAVVAAYC